MAGPAEKRIGNIDKKTFDKLIITLYTRFRMLELPHTLVGAVIASKIPNPLFSLPLALASHFLLDLVPHWNPSLYTETKNLGHPSARSTKIVIADTLLSLFIGGFIASRFWPDIYRTVIILLACFVAVAPDAIEGFYFFGGVKNRSLEKMIKFQHSHQSRARMIFGLLTQVLVSLLALYLLK